MGHEILFTISLLLDALRDPFTFALLITLSVLVIGYCSRRYGLAFFVAVSATFGATHIIKSLTAVPRPASLMVDTSGYRFPSLHAAMAGAFFASLWWYAMAYSKNPWFRVCTTLVVAFLIAFVGWSRVLLGVHLPIDVIAGGVLGTLVSIGTHASVRLLDQRHGIVESTVK